MSFPISLMCTLQSIDDENCGALQHELQWVESSNPVRYESIGQGDFTVAAATRIDLGNGEFTWRLMIWRAFTTPCLGAYFFDRSTQADNPVGTYCRMVSQVADCDQYGQAFLQNND